MRIFRFALLAALLLAAPSLADVRGIAFGFAQKIEPNFDGAGACRLFLVSDRLSVVDFPAGDLASACASLPAPVPGGFAYVEVTVEDANPLSCCHGDCPKSAMGGHFTAVSAPRINL